MLAKVFIFLIGTVCVYQVSSQGIYVAELMVESNVTLDTQKILLSWNASETLTVTDSSGISYAVTINSSEVVAECLIIGQDYNCNCSVNYAWSNEVCYNYNCCTPAECTANVSLATSICVPQTSVLINGSIPSSNGLTTVQQQAVQTTFAKLNGLVYANISARPAPATNIYDFAVMVSVKVSTSVLQGILITLQTYSTGMIFADTLGMVNIYAPPNPVDYKSSQNLNCTLEESSGSAGWNLSRMFQRFELNNGLQVNISSLYATPTNSTVGVSLKSVTSAFNGTYECGFTIGSVRHTARADMEVALLPDTINMKYDPLVLDCSQDNTNASLTATIPNTTETYLYWWEYNGRNITDPTNTTLNNLQYTQNVTIDCLNHNNTLSIWFQNKNKQNQTASVALPVLHAGEPFCKGELSAGLYWPKTPAGVTVFNQTCPVGRVGFRSRTCELSASWQDVYFQCISEDLNSVQNAAVYFQNGLGATPDVAANIFQGVRNSSTTTFGTDDETADINATIGIFTIMANASSIITLQDNLFPDLIESASNMVNSSWERINDTVKYSMSSNYLSSLENLVKNIVVNTSTGFNSSNLELHFCSGSDCSISVFGIELALNTTDGMTKTMAVKNLSDKLNNQGFGNSNPHSLVLSATLVNSSGSNITIQMAFPEEDPGAPKHFCVFWDATINDWSDEGCVVNATDGNTTLCVCSHLTSFSVLMSKSANISDGILDMITYVGLSVSIFSLIIFLVIEYLVWSALIKTNLSHFRHTAVVNIAMFRLLGDCSFLASSFPDRISDTMCFAFTVSKHLFYLAMFTWMLCLSTMLVHQLIFVFSPVRKRVFMFLSSIVGYFVPIVLVGASYVYYKYTNDSYYDRKSCWLVYEALLKGSIHAFLLPVGTITMINLFSMAVVIVTLVKTSVPDSSKSDDKETAKSILKVVVFLTPIFGVTWSIGFLLYTINPTTQQLMYKIVSYLFTILNSFQGFFILITGCIAEQKVRDELYKLIMAKTGRETDSMQKLTSATYTKDK